MFRWMMICRCVALIQNVLMITEFRVHGARLYVPRPVVARHVKLHVVWWPRETDGHVRCSRADWSCAERGVQFHRCLVLRLCVARCQV